MSRPSSRADDSLAALDGQQRFALQIETINEHAIGTKIGRKRVTIGRVGQDAMRVRLVLTVDDRSAAGVFHDRCRSTEGSIVLNRQQRDVPAVVVCYEDHASRPINARVAGRAALGRLFTDFRQCTGAARDCERADSAARFAAVDIDFVHRVEHTAIGVNGEERGIWPGVD